MDDVYSNIDKMIDLSRKKIELMIELKKALRLADLLGVQPKDLKDKVSTKHDHSDSITMPWHGVTFSVRVGDGPWQDYAMTEIHPDLWPEDMLEQFHRRKALVERAQKR